MAAPTDVNIEVSALSGPAPHAIAATTSATDPDSGDAPAFSIDWGDGTPATDTVAGETVAHAYTSPGRYTIVAIASVGADDTPADPVVITVATPNAFPLLDNDGGVCAPWFTVDDLNFTNPSTAQQQWAAQAVIIATRWINDATVGRWSGPCTTFVRPFTGRNGQACTDGGGGIVNLYDPIDLSLYLTAPILKIVEVRVDGEVVDADYYYLDGTNLVAAKGWDPDSVASPLIPWPPNDRGRHPGAPGTWDLTVEHGAGPPEPLRHAAIVLATEIVRQCCGDDECLLPSNVSSVSRDGVTISFQPIGPGRCGIPLVDSQIAMYGPEGYGRPPRRILDPAAHLDAQIGRLG